MKYMFYMYNYPFIKYFRIFPNGQITNFIFFPIHFPIFRNFQN